MEEMHIAEAQAKDKAHQEGTLPELAFLFQH